MSKINNKTIPKEFIARSKSVYFMVFGFPLFLATSYELYRRLELGGDRKVQMGELREDGSIREFSQYEIEEYNSRSIFTKLFGSK